MNPETLHALSTKEGCLAFLRAHPIHLLLSSAPEADGSTYHYYDVEGLPKGGLHGANLKACLGPECADFVLSVDSVSHWWMYTPADLGLHPAACTLLLAIGADALQLLHLPPAKVDFPVLGGLFQA